MFLSFFDLDRTLLSVNSSFSFCMYLYKKKVLSFSSLFFSFFYYIWHKYFHLSLGRLHQKVFKRFLCGMSVPLLNKHAQDFVELYIEKFLYFPAWERLSQARHLGHAIYIVSNSPGFLVRPIAEKFHVDGSKASEYLVDKDLRLCQIEGILQGEEKARFVKQVGKELGVCKEKSVGYSDSYLDLPFLYAVGKGVAVNPDSKLRQAARSLQWEEI